MPLNVTDTALQIYRDRVGSTAFLLRWAGVALIVGGCACAVANVQRNGGHGAPLEITAIVLSVLGVVLMAVAFRARTAYHRRRNSSF
jgi:drug/metabolite transporter (DMT)-like permease